MGFEVNDYYDIFFFAQNIDLKLSPLIRSQSVLYIPDYLQDGVFHLQDVVIIIIIIFCLSILKVCYRLLYSKSFYLLPTLQVPLRHVRSLIVT